MAAKVDLPDQILAKVDRIETILQKFDSVAVAYSGGVDSTVLLHLCSRFFAKENLEAYYVNSCLQSGTSIKNAKSLIANHFSKSAVFRIVELNPLLIQDFVLNTDQRCYHCKKSSYAVVFEVMKASGQNVLFDGTNTDDMQEDRPGLKAVEELGVRSPLLEAGFCKEDIRTYARIMGLANHNLPSNSCLATRIDSGTSITIEVLRQIEQAESFLHSLNLKGCRVRLRSFGACVELLEEDIVRATEYSTRHAINDFFNTSGIGPVYIGLSGR